MQNQFVWGNICALFVQALSKQGVLCALFLLLGSLMTNIVKQWTHMCTLLLCAKLLWQCIWQKLYIVTISPHHSVLHLYIYRDVKYLVMGMKLSYISMYRILSTKSQQCFTDVIFFAFINGLAYRSHSEYQTGIFATVPFAKYWLWRLLRNFCDITLND